MAPTRSVSRAVPTWAYYSHDAGGNAMPAYHENAVTMLYDQGHETFEGASGDDWISVAQSMRAYLRFSLLGGIVAEQIRRLGYSARVHSVLDGDVLQPPLLLLSGLGEVSRIGEVILNPYPRPAAEESAVVTTDLPFDYDKPIDFGLQTLLRAAATSARANARPARSRPGPKLMYNGYEIWKSDAEKCARYRITNQGGAHVRALHEDLPVESGRPAGRPRIRWVAMNVPSQARTLAALDDRLGRGGINPVKKWWWDIELDRASGQHVRAKQTHARGLNPTLRLKYEEQTLAVYPADVMPPPYPREVSGRPRRRHRAIPGAADVPTNIALGSRGAKSMDSRRRSACLKVTPPVFAVKLVRREAMTPDDRPLRVCRRRRTSVAAG